MVTLVQTKNAISTVSTATTVTVATTSSITAKSGLVVACAGPGAALSVTGSTDTFIKAKGQNGDEAAVFYVTSSVGGYTSFTATCTFAGGGLAIYVYEFSTPLIPVSSAGATTGTNATTWSSGAATGGVLSVGCAGGHSSAASIAVTGPGSGWTNQTAHNNIAQSGGFTGAAVSSYVIATGSQTYSGTASGSNQVITSVIASFVLPSFAVPAVSARQAVKRTAYF